DDTLGQLEILNAGSSDGKLTVNVKDLIGTNLPPLNLTYFISSTVSIQNFLIYPSPAVPGNTLTIGFDITQPSTVDLYVFNSLGRQVYRTQETFATLGYKEITWNGVRRGLYLGSGPYIAKLIATDTNGNTAKATTKFGVY
ncbi:MAG: hypothetical protein HRT90_01370, partial [Candidatus Margulisbacteria bacterium]|nr:hypothetical protein [Candidatus Margulisiibacteriota bacterium]